MTPVNDTEVETSPQEERGRFASATDRVRETASAAGTRASEAYAVARERTRSAYGAARDRASSAYDSTREEIDRNPAAALVGGLALGAILAAVLPKTRQEAQLLGDWGKKLNDRARSAASSAKEAGIGKLDELGVNTVKEKLASLAGGKKK